jgi:hypothetical protein
LQFQDHAATPSMQLHRHAQALAQAHAARLIRTDQN